jgi:hypothetical protein
MSWHRCVPVQCILITASELERQLWEIDENFVRCELTKAEISEHLAARKVLYEQLHPKTRQHVAGAEAANAAMGRGYRKSY